MHAMLKRLSALSLVCMFLIVPGFSQNHSELKQKVNGSLIAENIYTNPTLGMKITLPSVWDLSPPDTAPSNTPSNCRGPLCGQPEIDLILQTKTSSSTAYRVYLAGYRLTPEYQNRDRYPLSKFAESMLAGSLGSSGFVPIGQQSQIQIDGKPAYRLLTGNPGDKAPRAIGYVSGTHEYVFMLVLIARNASLQPLQSAIEAMKFGGTAN